MAANMFSLVLLDSLLENDDNNDLYSESMDDIIHTLALTNAFRRDAVPKVVHFKEQTVEEYTDVDFKYNFRINRATFFILSDKLTASLTPDNEGGKEPVEPQKMILIFLWYLANQDSMREIAIIFGVSSSTVLLSIRKVSKAVTELQGQFIVWPDFENQEEISTAFANGEVRNCVGCIDGTHIRLETCINVDSDYYNRKGFASFNLQLVVDDRLLIRDTYVGWPGCAHDARVFRNSPLAQQMNDGNLLAADKFIIGDAAYPNSQHLVTPFRNNGHLTQQQRFYNKKLSATRQVVERAIGVLKGRFRRLRSIYCLDAEEICYLIVAACVLHNLCILSDDDIEDMFHTDPGNHPNNYPAVQVANQEQGNRRDALVQEIWNHH